MRLKSHPKIYLSILILGVSLEARHFGKVSSRLTAMTDRGPARAKTAQSIGRDQPFRD